MSKYKYKLKLFDSELERQGRIRQYENRGDLPVSSTLNVNVPPISEAMIRIRDYYNSKDSCVLGLGLSGNARIVYDADGNVQGTVQPSTINDLITAMCVFRVVYDHQFADGRQPVFVDMGHNDGRVVAIAAALGYRAIGIEIDEQAYQQSQQYFGELSVPSLQHATLVHGDYRKTLGPVKYDEVDAFYNYEDNVGVIAHLMERRARNGALFLLHTWRSHNKKKFPLTLVRMIHAELRQNLPLYDVFEKQPKQRKKRRSRRRRRRR